MPLVTSISHVRRVVLCLLACTFLLFSVLLTAFSATNAHYNFPGVIECLVMGSALFAIGFVGSTGRGLTKREFSLLFGLVFLIALLLFRYFWAMKSEHGFIARSCTMMPGYFGKAECLLQLSFRELYGLRQILFHVTALFIFVAAASLSRMAGAKGREWLGGMFLIPALGFAVITMLPMLLGQTDSFLGSNFIYPQLDVKRNGGLSGNPSWTWPILVPALSCALGLCFSKRWMLVIVGAVSTLLLWTACFSVGQRAGYLSIVFTVAAAMAAFVFRWGMVRFDYARAKWRIWTLSIFSGAAISAFVLSFGEPLVKWLSVLLGASGRFEWTGLNEARLVMWRCAFPLIRERLWAGFGYNAWLSEFEKSCRGSYAFDTAHNLPIQTIFELGMIHSVVIFLVFFSLIYYIIVHKNRYHFSLKIGSIFFVGLLAIAVSFQEIDYIAPCYYQFALFAGFYFGGTSFQETQNAVFQKPDVAAKNSVFVWLFSALLFLFAFFYWNGISWGGFTFDTTGRGDFLFHRWFRPTGTIVAAESREHKVFSIFPNMTPAERVIPKERLSAADFYLSPSSLSLRNGSKFFPKQYRYQAASLRPVSGDGSRLDSFDLLFPPLQLNSLLLLENGTYGWEAATGLHSGEKWCEKSCSFTLYADAFPEPTKVVQVFSPMPEPYLSSAHPLRVTYLIRRLDRAMLTDLERRLNLPIFRDEQGLEASSHVAIVRTGELMFRSAADQFSLPFEASSTPEVWTVELSAERAFIPKEVISGNTDSRSLGFRLRFF